jgi:hypothetical protein
MSELVKPSAPESSRAPSTVRQSISLSGIWVTGDGLPIQIQQVGNQLAFQGVNAVGVVVVQGQGAVQEYQTHLTFQYYDGYTYDQGQTIMQISSNGRQMDGMVQYAVSGVRRPMRLVRQR